MSLSLLESVRDHISDAGLLAGYDVRFFRWTDKDAEGNSPLIMFRIGGSGDSNVVVQQTDVAVVLLDNPREVLAGDERMTDILRLFRTNATRAGIIRFLPLGTKLGPFYLDNGRPVWELTIRVFTEDQ